MSLFESASLVVTPNGVKASKLYAIKPTDGSGDLSVVRATTATRVNASGLIESVAANVPRLDYTDSTCPSILVEPQRTNLLLNSVFAGTGTFPTSWNTSIATGTSSPIASIKSTLVQAYIFTTSNSRQAMFQNQSYVSGNKYSVSLYVENVVGNIAVSNMILQLGTGTIIYYKNGQQILSTDFIESGNIYTSVLSATASSTSQVRIGNGCGGNTTGSITLSMPQFEVGSNATSYIPTTTASVTRNADVISKTGISSLIGQTEGTMFIDINYKADSVFKNFFNLGTSTSSYIAIVARFNNKIGVEVLNAGVQVNTEGSTIYTSQRLKIAFAYKANDFAMYINGVLAFSQSSGTVPAKAEVYLGSYGNGSWQPKDGINSAALWKTRLSNTELATLTTI